MVEEVAMVAVAVVALVEEGCSEMEDMTTRVTAEGERGELEEATIAWPPGEVVEESDELCRGVRAQEGSVWEDMD